MLTFYAKINKTAFNGKNKYNITPFYRKLLMAQYQDASIKGQQGQGGFKDRRARLSAKPDARNEIYGNRDVTNILYPLWETGGLLWPYTPTLADNISVNYETYDPVHSNQPYLAFRSVAAKEIVCSGLFTAQNQQEAEYSLAAIHFLRTITKMYFGVGSSNTPASLKAVAARGTPPPVLLFNAHGTALYHNVPVVVTGYSVELPNDVDYVELQNSSIPTQISTDEYNDHILMKNITTTAQSRNQESITAWIPTRFTITVNMVVQNSPNRWRRNFNLNDFRTGKLVKKGGWV